MAMYSDSSPVTLRGGSKKLILMGIYLVKNQLTSQFYREVYWDQYYFYVLSMTYIL